jgi:hypothetical protein
LLVGHEAITVTQAGWSGIKNGQLLTLAQEGFDVFLTIDQNMMAQQNLPQYELAVVVLEAQSNTLEALLPFVPKILELLSRPIFGIHRLTA